MRSKARARIHLARASARRPFSRDILLLQSHHTKPFFRESGMGKKAAPWRDQQGSSSSHAWGYWRGSWNTRSPSKPEPDGSKDISEFPKYHQMGQGGEAAVGQVTGGGAGDGQGELGDPLVKGLQKLLNQARKFDARARKCQTDLQLREEQWSKYQAQLRNSFLTQRHAYQQDRRKLEEEMAEVKIQKAKLVTQIQEVVQGRGRRALQWPECGGIPGRPRGVERLDEGCPGRRPGDAGRPSDSRSLAGGQQSRCLLGVDAQPAGAVGARERSVYYSAAWHYSASTHSDPWSSTASGSSSSVLSDAFLESGAVPSTGDTTSGPSGGHATGINSCYQKQWALRLLCHSLLLLDVPRHRSRDFRSRKAHVLQDPSGRLRPRREGTVCWRPSVRKVCLGLL